jgi:Tfp pilus assembly PilM family ATPase/Tfp pilus assembly protein PilN
LRQGLLKELYMTEYIGLDIGSHSIKLVGLKMTSKGPFLTCLGMKEIPPNKDKEDVNAFSEILNALVEEVGLRTKKVNLVVSGSGVQIKRISVPSLPKAELKEAVRWEMVWNQFEKDETVALIDLGAEKTGIYLFKNGILQFSREAAPAGADITKAIMEGIGSEGKLELIYERAEEIKQEMGIPLEPSRERTGDRSGSLSKISFLIRPVLERLSAEIGRSLDYYRVQFNEERIDRLLLTGGGANLKNIVSYLAGELRLPIEHFNPLSDILFDPKRIGTQFLNQMGSLFTIAVGVAFPEPKRIELLPAKEPFLSKIQAVKSISVLAPAIALLIFLGIALYMNGQVNAIQKEINMKKAKLANLVALQEKLKLLKEKDLQIKQKLSQFPSSMLVLVPYRDILREFNNILPNNVALTLLSVQKKGKPLKKGPPSTKSPEGESQKGESRELYITGMAFGSDAHCLRALAQIIDRLEKSSLYKNVKLASADENKLFTQPGAEFEIVCDINLSNPPSPTDTSFSPLYKRGDGGITKKEETGLGKEKR